MRGKPPLAFDLLAWNSDSTRMTAANHIAYLRGCYLENRLARGKAKWAARPFTSKVSIPIYHLATREDHIAPARSVFIGAQLFGGDVRYVLAGSGHIAGVINPVGQAQISILDRRAPLGRVRGLAREGRGASGQLVAGLDRVGDAQSPEKVARAAGRRRIAPARQRARRICQGAV